MQIYGHKFGHGPGEGPSHDVPVEGSEAAGCSSTSPNRTTRGRFLFARFSCEETIRKISANTEPKDPEQVYTLQKVQDGYDLLHQKSTSTRMLHGVNRPPGRLSTCPHSGELPKIPKASDPVEEQSGAFTIQGPPLRPLLFPQDLYQGLSRSLGASEGEGSGCGTISGRPVIFRQIGAGPSSRLTGSTGSPDRLGLVNQPAEVKSNTRTKDKILRLRDRLDMPKNLLTIRKNRQNSNGSKVYTKQFETLKKTRHVSSGSTDGSNSCCRMGQSPCSAPSKGHPKQGARSFVTGSGNPSELQGKEVIMVVERPGKPYQGSSLEGTNSLSANHGRQCVGLGGTYREPDRSREMVPSRKGELLQLERVEGHSTGARGSTTGNKRKACTRSVRQYDSGTLYTETGRYKKQTVDGSDSPDHTLGREEFGLHIGGSPQRVPQFTSGFAQSQETEGIRVGPKQGGLSGIDPEMGTAAGGLVRPSGQRKGPGLLLHKKRGSGTGLGCALPCLGLPSVLCLSPATTDPEGVVQIERRANRSNTDRSILAQKAMVCDPPGTSKGTSMETSSKEGFAGAGGDCPSRPVILQADRVISEEQLLKSKGFSDKLVNTLLASRKEVTRAIYLKVWKRYCSWCSENSFLVDSLVSVLEFLHEGMEKGLAASTLKTQVAALSVFLEKTLSREPLIARFFRALARIRPVQNKLFPSWDLTTVLQGLTRSPFEPLENATLQRLTFKTVLLIAVTSARRISELQALSCREPFLRCLADRVILKTDPGFLPKVATNFHRSQEIVLPTFCPNPVNSGEEAFHSLDVRRCLLAYLETTKGLRKSPSLFVLPEGVRKGERASKSTLARWLRSAIKESYQAMGKDPPEGILPHSTRAVATSWAERAGASPEQICKAATWTSFSTFMRHYRLDLLSAADQSFGRKVLQAVIPP